MLYIFDLFYNSLYRIFEPIRLFIHQALLEADSEGFFDLLVIMKYRVRIP